MNTHEPTTKGIIVGLGAVTLILLLGGLYIWGSFSASKPAPTATSTTEMRVPIGQAEFDMSGHTPEQRSDEISAIEADLEALHMDPIDMELSAIESELKE